MDESINNSNIVSKFGHTYNISMSVEAYEYLFILSIS